MSKGRVCLITSAHLSYNPRLIKEADALDSEGFSVRVVAMEVEAHKTAFDKHLMKSRSWRLVTVNARRDLLVSRFRWFLAAVRQSLFGLVMRKQSSEFALRNTYSRYAAELARAAAREKADLFIAHNLPALPAAAQAAQRYNAKLGFDAEDFHRGEFQEHSDDEWIRQQTIRAEEMYMPRCDYVTTPSDGIGNAYVAVLRIPKPITIMNVFPRSDRSGHTLSAELLRERQGDGISLYWQSQVIGPDRGLSDALHATAMLRGKVRLHLRGSWANGYKEKFEDEVRRLDIAGYVHMLAVAAPEELVERAAQHDIGLALEIPVSQNRSICMQDLCTNKIFTYLLAGLAIAATGTSPVSSIFEGAGFAYKSGDPASLAEGLNRWIEDPNALSIARRVARDLGEMKYNWDVEKRKFLALVEKTLAGETIAA